MAPEDVPTPKQEEKQEEQKAPAAKERKTAAKKAAKVADSVKCCGRGFLVTLTGKKNVDECVKALVELGYKEVLLSDSAGLSEDGSILTFNTPSVASDDSQLVTLPVKVLDGELRMELSKEDFPDLDEDEISVSELIEKWTEVNPSYTGCGMCYSSEYGVATPVLNPISKSVSIPISVNVYGSITTLAETEFLVQPVQVKDIIESLNLYSDDAELCKGNETYFVSFKVAKGISFDKAVFSKGSKSTASVVEKYALPFTIHLANFGIDIPVSENDFADKKKVTLEEVLAFLTPSYKMFGANDRSVDFVYLKDRNVLSVASISGKKG